MLRFVADMTKRTEATTTARGSSISGQTGVNIGSSAGDVMISTSDVKTDWRARERLLSHRASQSGTVTTGTSQFGPVYYVQAATILNDRNSLDGRSAIKRP